MALFLNEQAVVLFIIPLTILIIPARKSKNDLIQRAGDNSSYVLISLTIMTH
jgi:competence protein ComGC